MEGRPAAQSVRTHPALNGLLQLQTGATYAVTSASLAALLMAGPSVDGAWCAVVGTGELGVEAAAMFGVDLDRVVLVPEPGDAWLEVVAALVDVLGVVVVQPPKPLPTPKDISRLSARLRTRGSILVVWGDWPRCDARLGLTDVEWHGAGWGNGHLKARQATVEVRKGTAPAAQRRLWLPDIDLSCHPVVEVGGRRPTLETTTELRPVVSRPLRGTSTTEGLRSVS
jgi:hypothetical protein